MDPQRTLENCIRMRASIYNATGYLYPMPTLPSEEEAESLWNLYYVALERATGGTLNTKTESAHFVANNTVPTHS